MSDCITEDELSVILKRLPVKTLIRCQCVCKGWKQLISSKWFILAHLSLQKPRILMKHTKQKKKPDKPAYTVLDPQTFAVENLPDVVGAKKENRLCLVNCLHGVVCICDYRKKLMLWNPSTHQLMRIPLPPELQARWSARDIRFKCCAFWIEPCSHAFKVVFFCLKARKIALFSSKTRAWNRIEAKAGGVNRDCSVVLGTPLVLIGGVAAHFLGVFWTQVSDSGSGRRMKRHHAVLCFDFLQEKLGTVELPGVLEQDSGDMVLCRWKDCLSLVGDQFGPNAADHDGCVGLWVMQGGIWSKMFKIQFPFSVDYFNLALASADRAELESYDLLPIRDGCHFYRTRLQALLTSDFVFNFTSHFAYDFVESLVFPELRICPSSAANCIKTKGNGSVFDI